MRKLSANYIFPGNSSPLKNGILVINNEGVIVDIIDTKGKLKEIQSVEFYNGILVPGFVNAHCHIELSYLKKLGDFVGLPQFIKAILKERNNVPLNLQEILKAADKEMQYEGIVAVGDIINGNTSFEIKKISPIYYKSFVEIFDISVSNLEKSVEQGISLLGEAQHNNLEAYLTAHAPYSVSRGLFEKIKNIAEQPSSGLYSIHNQETSSENELFSNHSGDIYQLMTSFGADFSTWNKTESSLSAYINFLPKEKNILLIHNVFTTQSDIENLKEKGIKAYFVLCPNSNIIIENKLPQLGLLMNSGYPIAIGTDSYASNRRLSVLEELKTISTYFPEIALETLIQWACINGAKAIKLENLFGSFEEGKKPGVNLIQNINFSNMSLTPESVVKRLI